MAACWGLYLQRYLQYGLSRPYGPSKPVVWRQLGKLILRCECAPDCRLLSQPWAWCTAVCSVAALAWLIWPASGMLAQLGSVATEQSAMHDHIWLMPAAVVHSQAACSNPQVQQKKR